MNHLRQRYIYQGCEGCMINSPGSMRPFVILSFTTKVRLCGGSQGNQGYAGCQSQGEAERLKIERPAGEVSQAFVGTCFTSGLTRQCFTGTMGYEKLTGTDFYRCKGACNFGVQNCAGGTWTACAQEVLPTAEVCNGKDDDCDGQTDNGNPGGGTACKVPNTFALCADGQTACINGAVACQQINLPKTEICDGKDNDCDGQIDNSIPQNNYYPDTDKDGFGNKASTPVKVCAGRQPAGYVTNNTDCNDGDKAINPSANDVCDGVDNNSNCAYRLDGGAPKCGDTVYTSGSLVNIGSYRPSGTAQTTSMSGCSRDSNRCNNACYSRISYNFSMDNSTYGYTRRGSSYTLSCR